MRPTIKTERFIGKVDELPSFNISKLGKTKCATIVDAFNISPGAGFLKVGCNNFQEQRGFKDGAY